MNRNHTFRRPDRPFALLAVLAFLSGCAFYDGGFAYHVDGRIVDGDGAPLPQRPAMADLRLSATWDERVTFRTDDDGYFALRFMTGLTWGYMKLFNLIPLGSTKGPVPPRAESLHLAIQVPSGTWRFTELALTKEQQHQAAHAERWIDVGTVRISAR